MKTTEDNKSLAPSPRADRRRSRRWVVTLPLVADIADGVRVRGYLFDISRSGAYLVLDTNAEIGTQVTLTFRIYGASSDSQAKGHVARFEALARRSGIGIVFTEMCRSFGAFVRALGDQNESERIASLQLMRSLRLTLR